MPKSPNKPHDEFFKAVFSRLEIVLDYLTKMLPIDLQKELDFNSLTRANGSFVSPMLQEYFSDVVYRCAFKGSKRPIFISFIFEHKSSVEPYPHLQLLRYMLDTWEEQRKQGKAITPIIPIVVYHGKEKWRKRKFSAYFGKNIPAGLEPFFPNFDYLLTDLQSLNNDQILELGQGLLINAFLMMKHIWNPDYVINNAHIIFANLGKDSSQEDFIVLILAYFFKNAEIAEEKVQKFFDALPQNINKSAMTTYEMILEKGIEQGIEQTLNAATREMISNGCTDQFIMTILHVELVFIEKVRTELLDEQNEQNSRPESPNSDEFSDN